MRATPRDVRSHLERITLPALAYGASMSGITTREVIESTVPLPLAWETITPLDTEMYAARLLAHIAPFRPGLALSSITLLRQSTMNHFWPMVLRLTHLLRSTCT